MSKNNEQKQTKEVPAKTDGKELVASAKVPEHEPFAVAHLTLTAPAQYLEHGEVRKLISNAAVDLYRGLAPQDSLDALAATLAVSVSNASLDCLAQAARVDPRH